MFVSVVNSKGGVGKSTIAAHAAMWLKEQGVNLAVVDVDAQASTSEWLSMADPDVRVERCDTLEQLNERVPRLTGVYDVVLADGPAALSAETVALVGASDLVLLPIGPSMMDIRASYRTARVIHNARMRVNQSDKPRVVTVLNRVQRRTKLAQLAVAAVRKYGFPVAGTSLHLRQAYAEACGRGLAVWRLGTRGQHAAREIDRLFREVLGAIAPKAIVSPRALPAGSLLPRRSFSQPAYAGNQRSVPANALAGSVPGSAPASRWATPNPRRPPMPKE